MESWQYAAAIEMAKNKNKEKRKKESKLTKHHIIPKSRGGRKRVCMVAEREHRLYHALFDNKTPHEVLDYLTDVFWDKDQRYINYVYERNNKEWIDKAFGLVDKMYK